MLSKRSCKYFSFHNSNSNISWPFLVAQCNVQKFARALDDVTAFRSWKIRRWMARKTTIWHQTRQRSVWRMFSTHLTQEKRIKATDIRAFHHVSCPSPAQSYLGGMIFQIAVTIIIVNCKNPSKSTFTKRHRNLRYPSFRYQPRGETR